MKKIFSIIFMLLIVFILVGCGGDNDAQNSQRAPVVINMPDDSQSDTSNNFDDVSSQISIETPSISTEQSVTVDNQSISYCGNKNSKKFHKSSCGALKNTKDENKVYFKNRSDYISQGYVPCKRCNP